MMKDVSVVMPVRNGAKTITRALQSVLTSDFVGEVVVVDDGSTDGTADVVLALEDNRVRIVEGPKKGFVYAEKAGLLAARLPFTARCDADDWWLDGRLEWQRPWLEDHPDYIAVSGGFVTATETGEQVAELASDIAARDDTDRLLGGETTTSFCTWLTRTEALRAIGGGGRTWFDSSSDLDLQFRLAGLGRIWHNPTPCYAYVLHDASLTHSQASGRRVFFENAAREFARQRLEEGEDDLMRGCPPDYQATEEGAEKPDSSARQIAGQLTGQAWRELAQGNRQSARQLMCRAIHQDPLSLEVWRNFGVLMLKSL